MKRIIFLSVVISVLTFSCSNESQPEFTDQAKANVVKEVKESYDAIVSNLSLLDIDVWSEYWSKINFIAVTSGPNYFTELTDFTDSVSFWFSLRERQEVEPYRIDVTALDPELAILSSGAIWTILMKNGDSVKADASVSSLWMKEEDTWRAIYMHESWRTIE